MVPSEIGILPEYRGVTGTPRGVNGPLWALREKGERGRKGPRAPPPPSPNRTREGGRRPPPPFPFPLHLFPPLLLLRIGKRGSPTPGGSRTPPWRSKPWPAAPPPCSFIYGGRGAPHDTS